MRPHKFFPQEYVASQLSPFDGKIADRLASRQRTIRIERRKSHARNRLEPFDQFSVELRRLLRFVTGMRKIDPHEHQVFLVETHILIVEISKRSHEKPRANQEHERPSNLKRHHRIRKRMSAPQA